MKEELIRIVQLHLNELKNELWKCDKTLSELEIIDMAMNLQRGHIRAIQNQVKGEIIRNS